MQHRAHRLREIERGGLSQLMAPEPFIVMSIVPTCGTPQCVEGAGEMIKLIHQDQQQHDAENGCRVCMKIVGTMVGSIRS